MKLFPYHCDEEMKNATWSNKKWRQLYIVHKDAIIAVKDYPYHNDDINKMVVNWLREMAAERLGWEMEEPVKYVGCGTNTYEPLDLEYRMSFKTNNMYNDFGCQPYHWLSLRKDVFDNPVFRSHIIELSVPYSGASQCMICGDLYGHFPDESCLACSRCEDRNICEYCGENHAEYVIDDVHLCEYCYDDNTADCEVCGEVHLAKYMEKVYIVPRYTAEELEKMKANFERPAWRVPLDEDQFVMPLESWNNMLVCEWHVRDLETDLMAEGKKFHLVNYGGTRVFFAYADEMNSDALEAHGIESNDELKEYFNTHYTPRVFRYYNTI
jgi:hypothetical protein